MSSTEYGAELYSLLYTLTVLEKAFIRGSFTDVQRGEYTKLCDDMLLQYTSLIHTLDIDPTEANIRKSVAFIDDHEFSTFKPALHRVAIGINGFSEQERRRNEHAEEAKREAQLKALDTEIAINSTDKKMIAESTAAFITLLDAIKLNYNSKDSLHPLFSDVLTRTGKMTKDYTGRSDLVQWLIKLNKLDITDHLTDDQLKQALWDVDNAYKGFFEQL